MPPKHIPVLIEKVVELLNPQKGECYFDGTAGYGGHAGAIIKAIEPGGSAILADRDRNASEFLRTQFGDSARIIRRDYATAARELADEGVLADMVLLDLGVSSPQLDESNRGFSFKSSAKLDMRMDQSQAFSAYDVVNSYSERKLADIIYQYGEERFSRRIAKAIVQHRPINTTKELADIVAKSVKTKEDIHPATRTFQALRIEVNDEIEQLRAALPDLVRLLAPGGRMAIISFHSLEDRLVKEFINKESKDCICPPKQPVCTCNHKASLQKLTTKAIKGSDYDTINPRARSARLRAAVKIKNKGDAV